jgi:hypothetical protein
LNGARLGQALNAGGEKWNCSKRISKDLWMRMRWLRRNECQLGKNRQCLLCERAIFTMKAFTLRT